MRKSVILFEDEEPTSFSSLTSVIVMTWVDFPRWGFFALIVGAVVVSSAYNDVWNWSEVGFFLVAPVIFAFGYSVGMTAGKKEGQQDIFRRYHCELIPPKPPARHAYATLNPIERDIVDYQEWQRRSVEFPD